jgi:pimeloyl-ACP methyl ester carboxylesterase
MMHEGLRITALLLLPLVFRGTAPAEEGFLDAAGTRLHYEARGEGEAVMLVHGLGVSAWLNWKLPGIARQLRKSYRVVTFDNRGHGASGKPRDPAAYGIEMARDVIRVMDHLGIEKAHVAGYSLGGYITLKVCAEYPDRILSATVAAAGWQEMGEEERERLAEVEAGVSAGGYRNLLAELTPPEQKGAWPRLALVNLALKAMNDETALAALFHGMPELEVSEAELRHFAMPVLAIAGDHDPLGKAVAAMTGIVPDLTVAIVPGGTHFSTLRKDAFCNALLEFLRMHSAQNRLRER